MRRDDERDAALTSVIADPDTAAQAWSARRTFVPIEACRPAPPTVIGCALQQNLIGREISVGERADDATRALGPRPS
jgi:hypothetical protein